MIYNNYLHVDLIIVRARNLPFISLPKHFVLFMFPSNKKSSPTTFIIFLYMYFV